ncbi:hypothetical protein DFH11DRAFT_1586213 [Phellopilus nigrolimitatus]|nr:hypothetical protein DFH11DRAFT_1586213 [Phellopilus nigrolimitatus]
MPKHTRSHKSRALKRPVSHLFLIPVLPSSVDKGRGPLYRCEGDCSMNAVYLERTRVERPLLRMTCITIPSIYLCAYCTASLARSAGGSRRQGALQSRAWSRAGCKVYPFCPWCCCRVETLICSQPASPYFKRMILGWCDPPSACALQRRAGACIKNAL